MLSPGRGSELFRLNQFSALTILFFTDSVQMSAVARSPMDIHMIGTNPAASCSLVMSAISPLENRLKNIANSTHPSADATE